MSLDPETIEAGDSIGITSDSKWHGVVTYVDREKRTFRYDCLIDFTGRPYVNDGEWKDGERNIDDPTFCSKGRYVPEEEIQKTDIRPATEYISEFSDEFGFSA